MKIRPKNWSSFHHYRHRSPPWVKLHRQLLDDFDFQCLSDASRALAPMLWLIASESEDGLIEAGPAQLAFRLRTTPEKITAALQPLMDAGFFEVASEEPAPCKQDARPEERREEEIRDRGEEILLSAGADEKSAALDVYNLVAEELGWPKAQSLTRARERKLRHRLAECGGIEGWRVVMAKARASPFLRGERRDKAHRNWAPDFDFFLRQESFTRLMEGKYDDHAGNGQATGFDAILAGARRALAGHADRDTGGG
jgi:hypothetical protein